jgi:hypothetical protein
VEDDLGVGGGLEDRAIFFQAHAQLVGVDQVAVVGDGQRAARVIDRDRLRVLDHRVAGGGVAHVPDGGEAGEVLEALGGEDLVDVPHLPHPAEAIAVGRNDAR